MNFRFFGILIVALCLSGLYSEPVHAELSLYEIDSAILRPDVYVSEEVSLVKTLEEMRNSIWDRSESGLIDYLVSDRVDERDMLSGYKLASPPSVRYEKVNDARYFVRVENIDKDYILILNQRFHNGWKIRLLEKNCVSSFHKSEMSGESAVDEKIDYIDTMKNFALPILDELHHFEINGFNNAWLIPYSGRSVMCMSIDFEPQKSALLGHTISTLTLSGLLIFLIVSRKRKVTE